MESEEWCLLDGLGRLLRESKSRYRPGLLEDSKQLHTAAAFLEVELRRTFIVKEISRALDSETFLRCQTTLRSICQMLEDLASDRHLEGDLQSQAYPRLRGLKAVLESKSEIFDLVNGPNEKLFRLPCDDDWLCNFLHNITECNDVLDRLLALPTQERTTQVQGSRLRKKRWKETEMRNHTKAIVNALFENFKCDRPHEVLLKLIEHHDENPVLSNPELMLSKCPELKSWQEARCCSNRMYVTLSLRSSMLFTRLIYLLTFSTGIILAFHPSQICVHISRWTRDREEN